MKVLIIILLFLSIFIYADEQHLGTITSDGINNKVAQIEILGAGYYEDVEMLIIRDNTANIRFLIVKTSTGVSVTKMEDY